MKKRKNIQASRARASKRTSQTRSKQETLVETVTALPVKLIEAQDVPEVSRELDLVSTALLKQADVNRFLLEAAGITSEDLRNTVEQLRASLVANETKFFSFQGQVGDQRDVVNWKVRLEAIDKFLKLFKLLGGQAKALPSGQDVLKVEVDLAPGLKRARTA